MRKLATIPRQDNSDECGRGTFRGGHLPRHRHHRHLSCVHHQQNSCVFAPWNWICTVLIFVGYLIPLVGGGLSPSPTPIVQHDQDKDVVLAEMEVTKGLCCVEDDFNVDVSTCPAFDHFGNSLCGVTTDNADSAGEVEDESFLSGEKLGLSRPVFTVADDEDQGRNPMNSSRQTTEEKKAKEWKWIPEAQHRCNVVRVTRSELFQQFGRAGLTPLYHSPLVIYLDKSRNETWPNEKFANMTSKENIVSSLPPNFHVTLSSSNSFSDHRRTIPLTQYLEELSTTTETYPDQLSNETWYLFGETYTEGWIELLQSYELPPCQTCTRGLSALAFGIGNRGSGVQWHSHGPGFSESIHGRKHWVLYPPKKRPTYNPDYASRHWMEYMYMNIRRTDDMPWECTLEPGDLIYFPDGWYHATINLDPYTVFVSTFTTEHL